MDDADVRALAGHGVDVVGEVSGRDRWGRQDAYGHVVVPRVEGELTHPDAAGRLRQLLDRAGHEAARPGMGERHQPFDRVGPRGAVELVARRQLPSRPGLLEMTQLDVPPVVVAQGTPDVRLVAGR